MQTSPILIIGGGIGGLTLALAMARRGIACQLFEQAEAFTEVGAGLQLSPNAVRRLEALGLGAGLAAEATIPPQISIYDGLDGKALTKLPLGAAATARYGAAYRVMARPDLLSLLLTAIEAEPLVTLTLGKKLTHLYQDGKKIEARMEDESAYEGALLVGADGVWSRVRTLINRAATPSQTGYIAWRALIDPHHADALLTSADTSVYLGPDAHLVCYRVAGGDKINLVAVTKGEALQRSWSEELPPERLYEELRGWHAPLRRAVMAVQGWQAWPLMLLKPFQPWHKGRAVLMGDAAHAIVPFLAQGAAMAIEDAVSLAALIAEHEGDAAKIFPAFEAARFQRCQRVLSKSIYNSHFYHAKGMLRGVRNGMLKYAPPRLLMRQYDWLYEG